MYGVFPLSVCPALNSVYAYSSRRNCSLRHAIHQASSGDNGVDSTYGAAESITTRGFVS